MPKIQTDVQHRSSGTIFSNLSRVGFHLVRLSLALSPTYSSRQCHLNEFNEILSLVFSVVNSAFVPLAFATGL